MKHGTKKARGFIQLLPLFVVAGVILAGIGGYAYFQRGQDLGVTVYTTQLSNTINQFREQVNSSTANLNTQLTEVSSTLDGRGTLYTLNAPLGVGYGGTGMGTVPINGQYLMSSGTTPTWKNLVASSGISITYTISSTLIATPGFDNTANIAFSGNNSFAGSSTFNGQVHLANTTTLEAPLVGADYIPKLVSMVVTSTVHFSTSSTSFVVIGTSSPRWASTTMTLLGNHRVMISLNGSIQNSGTSVCDVELYVDGVSVSGGASRGILVIGGAGGTALPSNVSAIFVTPGLSSGSHSFLAKMRAEANNCTIGGYGNEVMWSFSTLELYN